MPPPKLTYANVISTLCLFLLLGGGAAFAASHLAKNSVGTKQLKKNAVSTVKIKNGAVTEAKISSAAQAALKGAAGPKGATGPQGIAGTSRVYQASGSVNYDKFSSSLFGSQVVSLSLPPGGYFAISTVSVQTVNAVASLVTCRLINGNGGSGSDATTRSQVARADGEVDNMSLAAGFNVTSGQSLNLQCSKSNSAASARITAANIVAVGVSSVTGFAE